MKKVCIIGAGGHGREIYQIVRDINSKKQEFEFMGFIDDNKALWNKEIMGKSVLGGIDWIHNNKDSDIQYLIGLGDPVFKKIIFDRIIEKRKDIEFFNAIHPSVRILDDVKMGSGVAVFPNCVVSINVTLSDHSCLNSGVNISHDSSMGIFSNANPYVVINGTCTICDGVYLGSGAIIIQNIKVGDWSVVGAGAVVIKDIPPKTTHVGVPTKLIKDRRIVGQ